MDYSYTMLTPYDKKGGNCIVRKSGQVIAWICCICVKITAMSTGYNVLTSKINQRSPENSNQYQVVGDSDSDNEELVISGPTLLSTTCNRITAKKKGNPLEKKLECTLEELYQGVAKKILITRDVGSSQGLISEQEVLKIQIKPGWKKGTKITFKGKGHKIPGHLPADIIFTIDEKSHPVYKREGDDLEFGVKIPLAQALTGCNIPVPLLGGDQMSVSVDDIIFPGYEKRIPGLGMPISTEDGRRGDLVVKFLVEFPTELSTEQRSVFANAP